MIVGAIVLFVISVFAFFVSIRSFMEKGFLINNAFIYASKQERDAMDKRPHYRQSGVIFLLIGLIFLLNGLNLLFETEWIIHAVAAIMIFAVVYAIASSVRIEKNNPR